MLATDSCPVLGQLGRVARALFGLINVASPRLRRVNLTNARPGWITALVEI